MNFYCLGVIILKIVSVDARGHSGGHSGGHSSSHGSHGSYGSHGSHGGFHGGGGYHVSSHHTYSYHPPSHITFTCRHCTHTSTYPVFHGQPPAYVYKYRDSSDRFGNLLTGLALYNLGRSSTHHEYNHYHTTVPDEKCSLQVIDKTHFEETPVDCNIMSSFLSQSHYMDVYNSNSNVNWNYKSPESIIKSSSESPVLQTVDDGYPLQITSDQVCMLWHNQTMIKKRKDVPCALLKEYAETLKSSGVPVYIWLPTLVGIVITISLCCQCCKKKKDFKEEEPLNQAHVIVYHSNVRVE